MWAREIVAVLEVELVLAGLLDRHRQLQPVGPGALGNVGAELLVDEDSGGAGLGAAPDGLEHALEDQPLGVGDRLGLLGRRVALDTEHLLLERAAVVEREDVQLAVVTKGHLSVLPARVIGSRSSLRRATVCRLPRVEHEFTGPPYTIGIEEELMILDAESLELVNAIETLLEPAPSGEIKPELMESVLEVSTDPCPNTARGGRAAAGAAAPGRPDRREQGARDRLGRHAPVRDVGGPADRRPAALPGPDLGAALRRPPGADLRDARPRRDR